MQPPPCVPPTESKAGSATWMPCRSIWTGRSSDLCRISGSAVAS